MPTEDYQPVISGSLKLKGVQDSAIKKKKKRSKPPQQSTSNQDSPKSPPAAGGLSADKHDSDSGSQLIEQHKKEHEESAETEETQLHGSAKTEAEIRHEERRRRRVRIKHLMLLLEKVLKFRTARRAP